MERTLQAPARHVVPRPEVTADVDVEEVTRKRAKTEARRKFRIVASTILAANKFRLVLDVEADKPEQAEREIAAAFETLEVHSSSKESVDGSITKTQGLCRTCPEVDVNTQAIREFFSGPNTTTISSFSITNQGYCTTGPKDAIASSDQLFSDPEETSLVSLHEWSKEAEGWPLPSLDILSSQLEDCPVDESLEDPFHPATGLMWEGVNAMQSLPETNFSDSSMLDFSTTFDTEAANETDTSFNRMESQSSILIKEGDDGMNRGRYEQERQGSSEGSLENLWKIEENSEDWRSLVKEVNDMITQKIQDLEEGSGREKVQKLVEDAQEITKKMGTPGSTSEGNKFRNMDAKATNTTLPTIRDTEQYLIHVFDKLESHVNDLSQNVHGRQRQLTSLQSMSRLIRNGRKALQVLGRYTDTISGKLNALVKNLNFRKDIVDRHLNKCAASITTVVQSTLEKQKSNFTSVASVKKWYSDERSSRQNLSELSSPTPSELYSLFPVLKDLSDQNLLI